MSLRRVGPTREDTFLRTAMHGLRFPPWSDPRRWIAAMLALLLVVGVVEAGPAASRFLGDIVSGHTGLEPTRGDAKQAVRQDVEFRARAATASPRGTPVDPAAGPDALGPAKLPILPAPDAGEQIRHPERAPHPRAAGTAHARAPPGSPHS